VNAFSNNEAARKKRHKRNTFAYAVYFAVVISATHVRYGI